MNKEFEEYVAKRCEKTLLSSKDYIEKEKNEDCDRDELQEIAERICYKQGFLDAVKMMMKTNN
jgi:hypothetical protein